MCKYCKIEEIVETGEKLNGNVTIANVKDGSQMITVSLNRYIDDDCLIHTSSLVIDIGAILSSGVYTVKDKQIKIKYCPFCGEKL